MIFKCVKWAFIQQRKTVQITKVGWLQQPEWLMKMMDAAFVQHFSAELGAKISVFPFQGDSGNQCEQPQMVKFAAAVFYFMQQM